MAFREKKKKKGEKNDETRSQTVSYLAQLLSRGKVELVKQMIKNDPSLVLAADEQNLTPLHHSCHEANFTLAKFLLKSNASLTARDEKGWNPLHCLGASQAEAEVFVKMCDLLLDHESADRALMAKTDSGSTFLHFLLANMTTDEESMGEILQKCIRLNADVDAQNEKGEAPLHRAALAGKAQMCRMLIKDAGARIDVRNKVGQTPLHLGIFGEWVDVCDTLLELGADIQVASEDGTCENLALQTRKKEIKELFQNYVKNQGNFKRLDNMRKKKVVMGKYRIGERLGSGAFGVVYKGLDLQTGRLVAIKQANRRLVPRKEIPRLQVEVQAMRRLDHPNCVKLYDYEETDQEISFIIEYMGGGSLRDAMDTFGTFPERLLGGYMADVLDALDYLHSQHVIHRDVKAGNILLTNDGKCKLADFGSCCIADKGGHLSIVGSPYWMSPEMVEGKASASGKSDVWALGVTLIELVWGHPPHYEKTKMQAMIAIVDLPLPPWNYEELSDEMNDFLVGCFIKIELFRPSPKDLRSHPWVKGNYTPGEALPYEHFHDLRKLQKEEEEEDGSTSSAVEAPSDLTSSPPRTPRTPQINTGSGDGEDGEDSKTKEAVSEKEEEGTSDQSKKDDDESTEATLASDGEGGSMDSPKAGGKGKDMARSDSDSGLVVSGPGGRSPEKSPKGGQSGGGGNRLLAFQNISKNQFRANAPLTVKRSSDRASTSSMEPVNPEGRSPDKSLLSAEGGKSEKKSRRTTLSVTPSSGGSTTGVDASQSMPVHKGGGGNSPGSRPMASMTMTMVQSWGGSGQPQEEEGEDKLPRVMSVNRMKKEKGGDKSKKTKDAPKSPGARKSTHKG
uniref:non-specific serine/threonine protein kinase n=1 Tax=Paramoeba aestuarina TaxID=180227 RepID=A0A7S4NMD0_9EUKA|mmetsp:Transcript_19439/g.30459  ORF Transcript_19439/g.30459 Transcript_19439/m.30459 type:complete len:846 (+) Transcript_19439:129-2666(+)|eukprot:CAMPEP_0201526012 /NCGR_PEP_ID=MMETSP0161_2-20130828/30306_1 /ASSEMBLY_ACC=CAM_ASM_000251 /TAXON_ID=180227 /ORGANISM="Neoparamoeba aestuarina, Strain SoJaBio B1-5/56/2" /LENGTH=845 /DNA_ID=CAMNT_0047926201 /DNA_START=183 /DNA_END=2720 /DNA_ORIENTATION=-